MKSILIVLAAALLFSGCHKTDSVTSESGQTEDETSIGQDLKLELVQANEAVKIGTIQNRMIKTNIQCTGSIEIPQTEIWSVHSRNAGFIRSISHLPGDYVRKGQRLFTIEQPGLLEKERLLLETKADLELANSNFNRKSELQEVNAASLSTLEEAKANKEFLEARYEGLRSELRLLGVDLDALENEGKFQSYTSVYASSSGYVHKVAVNQGQMVGPEDELIRIADDSHMHLDLQVLSKNIPLVEKGQPVQFSIPGNPATFTAEVIKINPMLNRNTGTLQVRCKISDESLPKVRAGMFTNAEIQTSDRQASGLPLEAVIKEGEQYYCYAVVGDQLKKVALEYVAVSEDFAEFDPGGYEQFVIAGAYYIE